MTRHKALRTKIKTPKTEIHVGRPPRSLSLDSGKQTSSTMEKLTAGATTPRLPQDKKRTHDLSDKSDTETPPSKMRPEEVHEKENTATACAQPVDMETDAAPRPANSAADEQEERWEEVKTRNEKSREKAHNNNVPSQDKTAEGAPSTSSTEASVSGHSRPTSLQVQPHRSTLNGRCIKIAPNPSFYQLLEGMQEEHPDL